MSTLTFGDDRSYRKDLKLLVFQLLDCATFIDIKNEQLTYKDREKKICSMDIYCFIFKYGKAWLQKTGSEYKINLYNDIDLLICQLANLMYEVEIKTQKILNQEEL